MSSRVTRKGNQVKVEMAVTSDRDALLTMGWSYRHLSPVEVKSQIDLTQTSRLRREMQH